jgi:hypothetical protein
MAVTNTTAVVYAWPSDVAAIRCVCALPRHTAGRQSLDDGLDARPRCVGKYLSSSEKEATKRKDKKTGFFLQKTF